MSTKRKIATSHIVKQETKCIISANPAATENTCAAGVLRDPVGEEKAQAI